MNHSQADLPPSSPPEEGVLDRALALVEFLRARCSWDAAQTPRSLQRYLLEESHEVVDAIERGDDAGLRDELGDLLLNLAFQIVLGEERAAFDRRAVVRGLEDKMRRRHPHLYGLGEAESWAVLKEKERADAPAPEGLLSDTSVGGDPLQRAHRIQERVASVGFDWPSTDGAWEKVQEEIEEVRAELERQDHERLEEEIGDLLFSVVNLARLAGIHAPTALARTNAKFTRRFSSLEALAREKGIDVASAGLDALDELWAGAKEAERRADDGSTGGE